MADQYRDNEWLPEENEGQRQSSARTGNTSRFAYTDKHMPNGNYREDPETSARSSQSYVPNAGSHPNNASGTGQRNAQRRTASPQGSGQRPRTGQAPQGGQRTYAGGSQPARNAGGQRLSYNAGQPAQGAGGQRVNYNNGQPAQNGGQRAYYGNGQPVQGSGQRANYNNGRPVQNGGQRAYYSNGQPVQGSGQRTYNNGQPVQGSGQRTYYNNGQPVQGSGQRAYYNNGQPVQGGGQRTYNNNGQPAQNSGGQRMYYGSGQPMQNAGGQRATGNGGQPAQNAGGQRAYSGSVQPAQGRGTQRTSAQNGQPARNAGAQRSGAARPANTAQSGSPRRETESGRVAQGQVRRTIPAGGRTASGAPVRKGTAPSRNGGAGDPPRNGGGRGHRPPSGSGKGPVRKKKKSAGMIALMVVLLILLGCLVFFVAFAASKISLLGRDIDKHAIRDVDDVYIDEHVKKDTAQANYTNLLLVGIDTRDTNVIDYANSDTMIICSINNTTGKVRLVSVYRDTYLNVMSPENVNKFQYNKANAAYNLGSAPQMISMINANLDLNIKDYAVVDFRAVIKLVDAVGGIDITLTDQEAIHMNNYQVETAEITGVTPQPVEVYVGEEPRVYHLNGIQATAYCRIRYTNGWDMKRTQRQRLVIQKIIEKVKSGGLGLINRILDDVLPLCYTSLDGTEILGMATRMFSFEIEKTTGFPEIHLGKDVSSNVMSAQIPVTLEDNVVELHKWLFDIDSYDTSQTVKDFSRQIILNTGYGPEHRAEAIADSEIGNSGGEADGVK